MKMYKIIGISIICFGWMTAGVIASYDINLTLLSSKFVYIISAFIVVIGLIFYFDISKKEKEDE